MLTISTLEEKKSLEFPYQAEGERFKSIRTTLGYTSAEEFGKKLGTLIGARDGREAKPIDKSTLSKYEKGKDKVSQKILVELFSTFKVSRRFWEEGELPMFTEAPPQKMPRSPFRDAIDLGAWDEDDIRETDRDKEFIDLGNGKYLLYTPLITHVASMGYLHGYSDPEWLEELPKHAITVDSIPRGSYRTFVARGLSMFDGTERSIHNNSKITGRVIKPELYRNNKLHLHKFKVFVIVHREGITIKEIVKHDPENGIITIHSWNPDKTEFPDIEIELKDVLQLLNVIRIERDL